MSSANPPSGGASASGSSRRHSIETICHPADMRCWITSGLNGPETTSRTRSKYAMGTSADTNTCDVNSQLENQSPDPSTGANEGCTYLEPQGKLPIGTSMESGFQPASPISPANRHNRLPTHTRRPPLPGSLYVSAIACSLPNTISNHKRRNSGTQSNTTPAAQFPAF